MSGIPESISEATEWKKEMENRSVNRERVMLGMDPIPKGGTTVVTAPDYNHPQKYMLRPNDVDAVLVGQHNIDTVVNWCGGRYDKDHEVIVYPRIDEKTQVVELGEYLIKGPDGKFYHISAEDFNEMFVQKPSVVKFNRPPVKRERTGEYPGL